MTMLNFDVPASRASLGLGVTSNPGPTSGLAPWNQTVGDPLTLVMQGLPGTSAAGIDVTTNWLDASFYDTTSSGTSKNMGSYGTGAFRGGVALSGSPGTAGVSFPPFVGPSGDAYELGGHNDWCTVGFSYLVPATLSLIETIADGGGFVLTLKSGTSTFRVPKFNYAGTPATSGETPGTSSSRPYNTYGSEQAKFWQMAHLGTRSVAANRTLSPSATATPAWRRICVEITFKFSGVAKSTQTVEVYMNGTQIATYDNVPSSQRWRGPFDFIGLDYVRQPGARDTPVYESCYWMVHDAVYPNVRPGNWAPAVLEMAADGSETTISDDPGHVWLAEGQTLGQCRNIAQSSILPANLTQMTGIRASQMVRTTSSDAQLPGWAAGLTKLDGFTGALKTRFYAQQPNFQNSAQASFDKDSRVLAVKLAAHLTTTNAAGQIRVNCGGGLPDTSVRIPGDVSRHYDLFNTGLGSNGKPLRMSELMSGFDVSLTIT